MSLRLNHLKSVVMRTWQAGPQSTEKSKNDLQLQQKYQQSWSYEALGQSQNCCFLVILYTLTVYSAVYHVQFKVYSVQFIVYTVQFKVYSLK